MRSVTRRPRGRPGGTTVSSLLEALERMLEQGRSFTTVSVDELAREAGISRATFYLHFRNKGDVVRRLMEEVEKEVAAAAGDWFSAPEEVTRDGLLGVMRQLVAIYDRHRAAIRAIVETAAYDPEIAEAFRVFMQRVIGNTRNTLLRLQAAGLARPGVPAETVDALAWMVERSLFQLLDQPDVAARENVANALAHVVWSALRAT